MGILCTAWGVCVPDRDESGLFSRIRYAIRPPAAIGDLKLEEKEIVARQAKERQRQHGGTAPGKAKSLEPNLAQVSDEGRTLEILARDIPMGRESLRKLDVMPMPVPSAPM